MKCAKWILITIGVFLLIVSSGCTSLKKIDGELPIQEVIKQINPGDTISVFTSDNSKYLIVVDVVTSEQIEGSGKVFKITDIIEIRKKKVDPIKTTGAIFTGFTVVLIFLIMILITAAGG